MKRASRLALGVLLAIFFLALVLREVDVEQFAQGLARVSGPAILTGLSLLVSGYCLRTLRWWWLLRSFRPAVPVTSCFWPVIAGAAVNNVLPFRLGDALRAFGFCESLQISGARILGTLVVERLLDLATLLCIFFLGIAGLPAGAMPSTAIRAASVLAALVAAIVLLAPLLLPQLRSMLALAVRLPLLKRTSRAEAISRVGNQLLDVLVTMRSPTNGLVLLTLSVGAWVLEGCVFLAIACGLGNECTVSAPFLALATGTLGTLLPGTPGYIGTFDYFAMQGFMAYGADATRAATFALAVHAMLWLPITVAGLCYLLLTRRRIGLRTAATIEDRPD